MLPSDLTLIMLGTAKVVGLSNRPYSPLFTPPPTLSAQLVLSDNFDWAGAAPEANGDLNINIPARQSGTTGTTYTRTFTNEAPGSFVAVVESTSSLSGTPDAMQIRTSTTATAGVVHQNLLNLDSDFNSDLAGNVWTVDYTARALTSAPFGDVFFGMGLGTSAPPAGLGAAGSDFFFAVRDTGAYLLSANGGLTQGSIAGFNLQEEYSVLTTVDETGGAPLLSIDVTPIGGSSVNVVSGLALAAFGGGREMGFQSSVVSDTSGGLMDVRLTGLNISVVPEPSTFALLSGLFALGCVMVRRRK